MMNRFPKVLLTLLLALVLALTLLTAAGCDIQVPSTPTAPVNPGTEQTDPQDKPDTPESPEEPEEPEEPDSQGDQDQYHTDPVPQGKPQPVEPEDAQVDGNTTYTCTVSISCATLLDNMDKLSQNKRPPVPADGVLLPETQVTFSAGESAFDVLQRVCRERGIHMDSNFTPMYNSAYVKGIANLYEFDVGSQSGWMYKVNGWFPNYGCSRYTVQQGDEICWMYTCVGLGEDIGGGYAMGG